MKKTSSKKRAKKEAAAAAAAELNCTCCSRPLYLLVAVMNLGYDAAQADKIRQCADSLRNVGGDPLLANFLEKRCLIRRGTRGVKLGAFVSLSNAEIAAKSAELKINELICDGKYKFEDFYQFLILRFSADNPQISMDEGWNGTDVKRGDLDEPLKIYHPTAQGAQIYDGLSIEWHSTVYMHESAQLCGDRKNLERYPELADSDDDDAQEKRKKKKAAAAAPPVRTATLVFCKIPYHGTTRMMELGLFDDPKLADEAARQAVADRKRTAASPGEPDSLIGMLTLPVDDVNFRSGLCLDYDAQLARARWVQL